MSKSAAADGWLEMSLTDYALGNAKYPIDPYRGDLFKTAIDLRSSVKAKAKLAAGHRKAELDAEQLALKILANSTSYGIFVEVSRTVSGRALRYHQAGPF
jgi:hypothetical protein